MGFYTFPASSRYLLCKRRIELPRLPLPSGLPGQPLLVVSGLRSSFPCAAVRISGAIGSFSANNNNTTCRPT
ncbi:hypothetical protein VTK56DRAFT_9966 [Thermocarpiscus australiensis]